MTTRTRQWAEMVLGEDLEAFVRSRREQQPRRPWRLIQRDLYEATDGRVDITFETLRSWFPDRAVAS